MNHESINVLLITPSSALADEIKRALQGVAAPPFRVVHVENRRDALVELAMTCFDVVLLDLVALEGAELDTLADAAPLAQLTPIIALSAWDEQQAAVRALRKGACDYVVKRHINAETLARTLRQAVRRQQLTAELNCRRSNEDDAESRLGRIIDEGVDGVVVVGHDGLLRFVNPAAADLLGRPRAELLGVAFGIPVGAQVVTEIDVRPCEGTQQIAEMRVVEMEWDGTTAFLMSLRDVSERHEMLQELVRANEERLDIMEQFLSHVSHELRSPLSPIHQFITILLDDLAGKLNPKQREYVEIVLRNVDQLRCMIDQLLETSRAATGKLTVRPRIVSSEETIVETVRSFGPSAAAKEISLTTQLDGGVPPALADRERIRQVLSNLLDNAIKFTPHKGSILVRAGTLDTDPDFLRISVEDTGCGIAEDVRPRIFERLYQGKSPGASSGRGLGLGLHISRELILRLGGRVWVESELGEGSRFSFTLPAFSLTDFLKPAVTHAGRLRESFALLTVDVLHGHYPSAEDEDRLMEEVREILEHCIMPDRDVLLPRTASQGISERFFIVCSCDSNGLRVVKRRIERQLALDKSLADSEVGAVVSAAMVVAPRGQPGTSNEAMLQELAATIEDQIGSRVHRRSA